MALFALDNDVPPGQRKAGFAVVETGALPGLVVVAGLALVAQLGLVLVVFLVAAVAGLSVGMAVGKAVFMALCADIF